MATPAESLDTAVQPYQSLYRRYRPQRFSDVRGQEHVALALRNAVRDNRVAHSYLFSGPRGTGKTSTARILAKALDCEAPIDGEPCCVCASCVAITAGTSFDVHELDAASNNGVDAMRDLVARSTLATPGRWKVYIVDEVHMLSTAASNALLKTLEEPPDHVIFVLATTDPQKVLATIRSRTQHFEFHLINQEVLDDLLSDIATDAGLTLPEGALATAVRRARGSARDALSVLDQVAAAGLLDDSEDAISDIVTAMGSRDSASMLLAINEAMNSGHDPQQLGIDVIERLRAGFLAQFGATAGSVITDEERDQVLSLGTGRCVRAMELIGAAIVAMREAPEPRITLEVAMIRCTHPEAETTPEALVARIERLERGSDQAPAVGATQSAPSPVPVPPAATAKKEPATPPSPRGPRPSLGAFRRSDAAAESPTDPSVSDPSPASQKKAPDATMSQPTSPATVPSVDPPTLDELVGAWEGQILTGLRAKARSIYQAMVFVGVEDGVVLGGLPNNAHILHAEPLRPDIEAALATHFGRTVQLRLVVGTLGAAQSPTQTGRPASVHSAAPSNDAARTIDEGDEDFTDIGTPLDAHEEAAAVVSNVAWAENRLREAFPGAEEISE